MTPSGPQRQHVIYLDHFDTTGRKSTQPYAKAHFPRLHHAPWRALFEVSFSDLFTQKFDQREFSSDT